MSSLVVDIFRELLFRNRDRRAIPVLDGPMRPNSRLDECPVLSTGLAAPDDIAFARDGTAYVTSGRTVFRFVGGDFTKPVVAAEFDGLVTGLSAHPGGGVAVCVTGRGIAFIDGPASGQLLEIAGAGGFRCPTALAANDAGDLFICDGSTENSSDRWAHDLMEKRRSGRVLRIDGKTQRVDVLANGLAYPNGICITHDGGSLLVSEAWSHDILRLALSSGEPGRRQTAIDNLPGYPSRIIRTKSGYALALFALRTQLVDFVLTEDSYRRKMIERVDPEFWISPALKSDGHYLEPVQGGGLRKHGSVKAWAPPRSYGLVMLLDREFEVETSLHSRVGGTCHGITGLAEHGGEIFVVSQGDNKIVQVAGDMQ